MRISHPLQNPFHDTRRFSAMSVLSHLHQLFNAEQCQAYIHTLRWKDRPLQCPRCQSHHIGRWGTYQYRPGCKRYWCYSCKRTFNDLTNTLLHQSKRPLAYWILATFLLGSSPSLRPSAKADHTRLKCAFASCVHCVDHMPSAGSA